MTPARSSPTPKPPARPHDRGRPRAVGAADLHHRRHRDPRRQGGRRGADRRRRRAGQGGDPLRRPGARPPTCGASSTILKLGLVLPAPSDPAKTAELAQLAAELDGMYGRGEYCPPGGPARTDSASISRTLADVLAEQPRPRGAAARPGSAGTRSRRRCAPSTSAWSSSPTRARASSGYADTRRPLALQVRHAARRLRPASSTASGARSSRSTTRSTATSAASLRENYGAAGGGPTRARSRPTSSATCGRSPGTTSTTWWRRPTPIRGVDLTDVAQEPQTPTPSGWSSTARTSSPRSASRRCPRPSGSARMFTKPRDRDVVCHASAWDID